MSETVKVLCFKSKTLSNGEHPLMLCVCKDRKRKYLSTGLSVKPEHWDFKKNVPKPKCPNGDRLLIVVNEKINEVRKTILDKIISGKDYTAASLLDKPESSTKNKTVGDFYLQYIDNLKKEKRVRYAGMYVVSYSSFIKFNKHLQIPFSDIDVSWLKRYEAWMKENGMTDSTTATRLRHLRAVFNYAISEHAIKSDCYPFLSYKVAKLNHPTQKRAISKKDILKIMSCKGTTDMEKLAIDVFVFSYIMAGINFIDIAMLQRSNLIDGQLIYTRHKTHKPIRLPIQDKAMEIIAKYENDKSPFLFPILSPFHETETQQANRLHKILAKLNKHLKEIGERLKLPIPLTTYVARHSFATVLKRSGVSTSIISESLGHSSERITQTYLDSFENKQIQNAMKNLL